MNLWLNYLCVEEEQQELREQKKQTFQKRLLEKDSMPWMQQRTSKAKELLEKSSEWILLREKNRLFTKTLNTQRALGNSHQIEYDSYDLSTEQV